MDYHCSVCSKKIKGDLMVYIDHTERHIIDEIRMSHPQWVEHNGVCKRCVEYYRDQIKGA